MPQETIELPDISYLRILDADGVLDEELEPEIPEEDLVELYRTMVRVREFDERRLRMQRQGRIGTFAPVKGQEAAQLGSAYALRDSDWLVPSYRETAALIWRGMRMEDDLLYAAGYEEGVNLPEGARNLPISIPIASQTLHATGIGWGARLRGLDDVVLVYFGDGATSEGDFHEAMNFAQVYDAPVIFLCQNNQYAISVPRKRQTESDTIAQKAVAYGTPGRIVDGNDILAVYAATAEAVERARAGEGPTLIEAVTYRLSVHTTADDPKRYRDEEEVEEWEHREPITRFRTYLIDKGLMTEEDHETWLEEAREAVQEAVERFEEVSDGDPVAMFDHSLERRQPYLERQRQEFLHGIRITPQGEIVPDVEGSEGGEG